METFRDTDKVIHILCLDHFQSVYGCRHWLDHSWYHVAITGLQNGGEPFNDVLHLSNILPQRSEAHQATQIEAPAWSQPAQMEYYQRQGLNSKRVKTPI